jgi:hypothetical protein
LESFSDTVSKAIKYSWSKAPEIRNILTKFILKINNINNHKAIQNISIQNSSDNGHILCNTIFKISIQKNCYY